jgi:hypothetical protein
MNLWTSKSVVELGGVGSLRRKNPTTIATKKLARIETHNAETCGTNAQLKVLQNFSRWVEVERNRRSSFFFSFFDGAKLAHTCLRTL